MSWFLPLLLVLMMLWTLFMWPRLRKVERWVAIITMVAVAYAIIE